MVIADYSEESRYLSNGYDLVLGVDEVGRGSFAGPVVAAGVIFKPLNVPLSYGITDSKKLTPQKRNELSKIILKSCLFSCVISVNVYTINKVGIGKATTIAIRQVVAKMRQKLFEKKVFILIDGYHIRYLKNVTLKNQKGIIKGDQKSISIAAASIVAKVYRDKLMEKLHFKYPEYLLSKNKGYGTLDHRNAIKKFGLSVVHRTSFNLTKFI